MNENPSDSGDSWSMLRAYGPHSVLVLLAAGALLWHSSGSDAGQAAGFFGFAGPTVLLAMVSSVLGPFAGGNEAEWTMYLEKALKAERDRLMAMLNTMEEGVAIIGPDHKIRFMNPSMVRDFGAGIGAHCYRHLYGFDEPCHEVCKLPQGIKGSA